MGYASGAPKGEVSRVWALAWSSEQIAVKDSDTALIFVDHVQTADARVPYFSWSDGCRFKTNAVQLGEEAGEALNDGP